MEYDAPKIFAAFEREAREVLQKNVRQWLDTNRTHVQRLQGILNTIKIDLVHNQEWPSKPDKLWSGLRDNLIKIRHWISAVKPLPEGDEIPAFISEWKAVFDKQLSQIPELVSILIGESYWVPQPNDRTGVRLLKKLQPARLYVRHLSNQAANSLRLALQHPPYRLPAMKRHIHLHLFARNFIDLPVREMLASEWQKFLQSIFGQMFMIHEQLKEICKIALLSDDPGKLIQEKDDPARFNELFNLAERLKEIEIALQTLDNYQQQIDHRIDSQLKSILATFQNHWEMAGTFQYRTKRYSVKRIKNREYRLNTRIRRQVSGWQNQSAALTGQWHKDVDLIVLKLRLAEVIEYEYTRFDQHYTRVIKSAFTDVTDRFAAVAETLGGINGDSNRNHVAITDSMEILKKLPGSQLAQMLELLSHLDPIHLPATILKFLEDETGNLNHDYLAFLYRDSEHIPPRSKAGGINLSDILQSMHTVLRKNYDQFVQQMLGKQEAGLRILSKLDQMIGYNLQMAEAAIRTPNSENRSTEIAGNLEHVVHHAGHSLSELEQVFDDLVAAVKSYLLNLWQLSEHSLTSFFENREIYRIQRRIRKAAKRQKVVSFISQFARSSAVLLFGLIRNAALTTVRLWRAYIGTAPSEPSRDSGIEINKEVSRFLSQTEEKIAGLPLVYRNLFRFEPLDNDRLYAARIDELNQLETAFRTWLTGKPQTCAIIGEMGSGRTTLLNMARKKLFSKISVIDVAVPHPPADQNELVELLKKPTGVKNVATMDELIDHLLKTGKKRIGIIENVNDLFLRTVAGLSLVERLLDMIHQTSERIFWTVTATPYSWQYLQKTINIDAYFDTIVQLNSFNNGDIESIITTRHRMSGYEVQFESNGNPEENRKLRRMRSEESRQNFLRARFFSKLNQISDGNITIAMLYWLRAIGEFANDKVILSVAVDFNFSFLSLLSNDELFSLAAIINHEDLTPEEHALIFHQTREKSRLQLTQMVQAGLLLKKEGAYGIHPFLYRHLVELLKSRKILY